MILPKSEALLWIIIAVAFSRDRTPALSQGLLSNLPMEHSVPCTQEADRQRMDSQRGSGGTRTV